MIPFAQILDQISLLSTPWIPAVIGVGIALGIFLVVQRAVAWRLAAAGHRPVMPTYSEVDLGASIPENRDRRGGVRRVGSPVAVWVGDAEGGKPPVEGWVRDRSTGGLGLVLSGPVDVGMILRVRAGNAPESMGWVRVEVRHCRENKKQYIVGCRFERTPPWNVLLMFG